MVGGLLENMVTVAMRRLDCGIRGQVALSCKSTHWHVFITRTNISTLFPWECVTVCMCTGLGCRSGCKYLGYHQWLHLKSYTTTSIHIYSPEVLEDDLTKLSSLPHQVWIGCEYVREQLDHQRIDLLPTDLSSAKSPQTLIWELLHINIPPIFGFSILQSCLSSFLFTFFFFFCLTWHLLDLCFQHLAVNIQIAQRIERLLGVSNSCSQL